MSGTRDVYFAADLDGQLRNTILAHITDGFANSNVAFLDLAANQTRLAAQISERLKPVFAALGLELTQFVVENISLPEELAKVLDQRIGMKMVGDMGRYTQYAAAESLDLAAANTGGGAGVGMGLGAGAAVAQVLASTLRTPAVGTMIPAANAVSTAEGTKFCIECGQRYPGARQVLRGVRKAAMSNCPACGAPLDAPSRHRGLSVRLLPQGLLPGQEEDGVEVSGATSDPNLNCPVCFQPLVKASLANTALLYCTQCHGLLLPMEIVANLVESLRANLDRPAVQTPADRDDLKRVLQCPKCNLRMDAHRYAGPGNVVVDTCDNCSLIWLDRGEITRIASAPDEGDLERTYGF